jgi:excisionase family DNA binding protein
MSVYLTCAQVADELGVSTRTVLRWVDRGALEAVRLPGGRLRVSDAALAAHLAAWATVDPTRAYTHPGNASGPAQRELPGPGIGIGGSNA